MIFQAYYLISSLSIEDNVLLPRIFAGTDEKKKRKEQARLLLQRFGVEHLRDRSPRALSGGQQQRVAIARALINNPSIILADEPVGNLDSASADNVMRILYDLNQLEKKMIILVTHDPRFLKYAHRIYHVKDGTVTQEVVNYERPQIVETRATERVPSQLETLARLYPYLSKKELKARALAHYMASNFSIDAQERLEKILGDFIEGKISPENLVAAFDRPYSEGGIGMYRQTASDFGRKIEAVVSEAKSLQEELERETQYPEKPEVDIKADKIRRHLLDSYEGTLSPEQVQRIERALKARILGAMNGRMFEEYLDRPVKQGGAGLNSRTAKNFTREVEIIIGQAE